MVAVAQDPAMLSFLDAGVNVKGLQMKTLHEKLWSFLPWVLVIIRKRYPRGC